MEGVLNDTSETSTTFRRTEGPPFPPTYEIKSLWPSQAEEINAGLLPLWLLCEISSGTMTLIFLYLFIALFRHAYIQTNSRLAKRQRDSMMFASRDKATPNDNQNNLKLSDTDPQQDLPKHYDYNPSQKIPYNEQISVESSGITSFANSFQAPVVVVHRTKSKERDQGKWLLRLIVLCVLFACMRGGVEQVLIVTGHFSDNLCNSLTKCMIAFTAVCLHSCHVFLWLRQLTFYSNPVLKPLRSKKLKFLSYAAYAVMPMTLSVNLALYIWWRDYVSIDGSCKASDRQNLNSYVPFGVLVACTVTIQILLSALFLYPLVVHKIRRRRLSMDSDKQRDASCRTPGSPCLTNTRRQTRNPDKLMQCIKRVLYGATVGITTDVVGGLIGMFLPDDIPMFAYSVLYNLNVSLNVFCLIYTFANWRQMLFPWCCAKRVDYSFRDSSRSRRSSMRRDSRQRASIRTWSIRSKNTVQLQRFTSRTTN